MVNIKSEWVVVVNGVHYAKTPRGAFYRKSSGGKWYYLSVDDVPLAVKQSAPSSKKRKASSSKASKSKKSKSKGHSGSRKAPEKSKAVKRAGSASRKVVHKPKAKRVRPYIRHGYVLPKIDHTIRYLPGSRGYKTEKKPGYIVSDTGRFVKRDGPTGKKLMKQWKKNDEEYLKLVDDAYNAGVKVQSNTRMDTVDLERLIQVYNRYRNTESSIMAGRMVLNRNNKSGHDVAKYIMSFVGDGNPGTPEQQNIFKILNDENLYIRHWNLMMNPVSRMFRPDPTFSMLFKLSHPDPHRGTPSDMKKRMVAYLLDEDVRSMHWFN